MLILLDKDEKYIDHLEALEIVERNAINTPPQLDIHLNWRSIDKTNRLLVLDPENNWQEYTIASLEEYKDSNGSSMLEITAEHSVNELYGDFVEDRRFIGSDARTALTAILDNSRWTAGVVDNLGLNTATFYRISAYEALVKLINTWGAEMKVRVTVTGTQITGRYIDLFLAIGNDLGTVLDYDTDLSTIRKKTLPRRVFTALYGYGKGEAIGDGYGRRLDFADINGGKAYVENNDAKAIWGRNSATGKVHVFGSVVFDDIEDPALLKTRTEERLEILSSPEVSYEVTAVRDDLNINLGDMIGVKDAELGVEIKVRAVKTTRNLLDPSEYKVTLGNSIETFLTKNKQLMQNVSELNSKSPVWDRAEVINPDGTLPTSALDDLIAEINARINATGGYVYISGTGEGITTYDKPVDQNPTSVIQLVGGAWRIANSKLGNGEWDWRTIGTGEGIVADALVAGVLRSADNSVWIDLDNGTFNFSNKITWDGTTMTFRLDGGQTVEEYVAGTVTSSDVEYYLSTSSTTTTGGTWSTTAPAWAEGKYMWSRTKITYKNGTTEYRPTANGTCIAGATGKGIASTTEYYYLSTSPTTLAGGTWSTTAPTWQNGKYIWTKTRITYTDTNSVETNPICVTGSPGYTPVKGTDYFDGQPGQNGTSSYMWVRYSQNSNGNPMTTDPTDAKYIGVATTTVNTAPSGYASYNWSLIKGTDGTPGEPGADGQTSYLHIRYSNDGGATFTANNGKDVGSWIGMYVDFTEADSTNVTSYTWNKVKGEIGPQGPTGTGVSSVLEYYLATSASSGVTTATAGWTTAIQTMTVTNKYLWNYEKINFSDGSSQTTTPVIIGVYGNTGATGRALTAVTEYYLASDLATGVTRATAGWTTAMQLTDTTKKYLWNYEKLDWSVAPTTTYVEPVIIGVHGETGPAGRSITSVDVQYYLSTSATALSGGSWSTTAPAWVDGKYIWSKTVTTYSTGNPTESTPVCITGGKGATGSTGSTGATGRGVSSIVEEFYLSTSKTTQTGGSWSTTMPTWSSGKYVWTRSKITYTSGTPAIEYTTPLVSSEWEAVNEIQVGGRNLFKDSNYSTKTSGNNITLAVWGGNVQTGSYDSDVPSGLIGLSEKRICTSSGTGGGYHDQDSFELVVGETYTLSYWAKGLEAISHNRFFVCLNRGADNYYINPIANTNVTTDWKKYSGTFTVSTGEGGVYRRRSIIYAVSTSWISHFKLEKGNKATDWTPAPEDDRSYIDQGLSERPTKDVTDGLAGLIYGLATEVSNKAEIGALQALIADYNARMAEEDLNNQAASNALSSLQGRQAIIETIMGEHSQKWTFVDTAMDFGNEGIFIGNKDTNMGVLLGTDRISFMDKGTEVAYISNKTMQINHGIFVESARIGSHLIQTIPGTDITTFTYVG